MVRSLSAMRLMRLRQDGLPAVGPEGARLSVLAAMASRASHWAAVSSRLRRENSFFMWLGEFLADCALGGFEGALSVCPARVFDAVVDDVGKGFEFFYNLNGMFFVGGFHRSVPLCWLVLFGHFAGLDDVLFGVPFHPAGQVFAVEVAFGEGVHLAGQDVDQALVLRRAKDFGCVFGGFHRSVPLWCAFGLFS